MKHTFFIFILAITLILSSCEMTNHSISTTYDLACSKGINELWIEEAEQFVPYLVIEKNYNGQVLLLRKYALKEPMAISNYYSYYENSDIDVFLNSEFLKSLAKIENLISVSNIAIMANEAIGTSGTETIEIQRKVFLLSLSELDVSTPDKEGQSLHFFSNYKNRLCTLEDGLAVSWWLRTANTWNTSTSYVVGSGNKITSANSNDCAYVRPAFCVKPTTAVFFTNNISKNTFGYVLDNNF